MFKHVKDDRVTQENKKMIRRLCTPPPSKKTKHTGVPNCPFSLKCKLKQMRGKE